MGLPFSSTHGIVAKLIPVQRGLNEWEERMARDLRAQYTDEEWAERERQRHKAEYDFLFGRPATVGIYAEGDPTNLLPEAFRKAVCAF